MYAQLVREGCTPNLVTYNILIDIYGKTAQWQEAMKLLDALHSQARLPLAAHRTLLERLVGQARGSR